MNVETLINNFIWSLENSDQDIMPYIANKKDFDKTKDTVYYSGPYWDTQEVAAAIGSLVSGKWLSSGEAVRRFEREFSAYFNHSSSLMVNSGSSANLVMIAALKKYFDWQDGDEIIVSCVGFPTTISAIVQNGLKPVFVDINYNDLNWDLSQIEPKITKRTKAVFSSPVLGNPYDIDQLVDICDRNDLLIISDNCDSLGSKWDGKYLTEFSIASSCSFYPAHHITTMEGGMISSDNDEIIKIARSIAFWGRDCYCIGRQNLLPRGACGHRFDCWIPEYDGVLDHKYIYTNMGYNLKPIDLQGAIGSVQLKKFPEVHELRIQNKNKITESISKLPHSIRTVGRLEKAETSWFGVPIICASKDLKQRFTAYLESNRIQTRNYFAGNILMHPAYKHLDDAKKYPRACDVLDHVFFIGCSPTITESMIDYIDEVISNFKDEANESVRLHLRMPKELRD